MRVSALQCKKTSNRFKRFFAMHHPVDSPTGRIALSPVAPVFKRPVQKLPRGAVYFLGKLLTLGIRTTEVQGW
ncbi:hypothetical protein, partial [Burkholderia gladioli]|uniref:hypothetical protein n=1 Tax=Burkholderia gladioli TaxID=28095 RepID=UPI001ABA27F5